MSHCCLQICILPHLDLVFLLDYFRSTYFDTKLGSKPNNQLIQDQNQITTLFLGPKPKYPLKVTFFSILFLKGTHWDEVKTSLSCLQLSLVQAKLALIYPSPQTFKHLCQHSKTDPVCLRPEKTFVEKTHFAQLVVERKIIEEERKDMKDYGGIVREPCKRSMLLEGGKCKWNSLGHWNFIWRKLGKDNL